MAIPSKEHEDYLDDEQLRERVRDYWHHLRLLDAGEAGVLDEDEANDEDGEMSPSVVAALIEAIMEGSGGWDTDRRGDEVHYRVAAGGIGLIIQVSFPEWAVLDQAE